MSRKYGDLYCLCSEKKDAYAKCMFSDDVAYFTLHERLFTHKVFKQDQIIIIFLPFLPSIFNSIIWIATIPTTYDLWKNTA